MSICESIQPDIESAAALESIAASLDSIDTKMTEFNLLMRMFVATKARKVDLTQLSPQKHFEFVQALESVFAPECEEAQ